MSETSVEATNKMLTNEIPDFSALELSESRLEDENVPTIAKTQQTRDRETKSSSPVDAKRPATRRPREDFSPDPGAAKPAPNDKV